MFVRAEVVFRALGPRDPVLVVDHLGRRHPHPRPEHRGRGGGPASTSTKSARVVGLLPRILVDGGLHGGEIGGEDHVDKPSPAVGERLVVVDRTRGPGVGEKREAGVGINLDCVAGLLHQGDQGVGGVDGAFVEVAAYVPGGGLGGQDAESCDASGAQRDDVGAGGVDIGGGAGVCDGDRVAGVGEQEVVGEGERQGALGALADPGEPVLRPQPPAASGPQRPLAPPALRQNRHGRRARGRARVAERAPAQAAAHRAHPRRPSRPGHARAARRRLHPPRVRRPRTPLPQRDRLLSARCRRRSAAPPSR